jgi:hypothetical protein
MEAVKAWFDNDRIYIETDDGRTLWQSVLYYPRLVRATPEQRARYALNGFGIRWEELNEDVSFESFEYDNPEPVGISRVFLLHPELNASAVARRMGIQQSLLAQYINGVKTPSPERTQEIVHTLRQIGAELSAVSV